MKVQCPGAERADNEVMALERLVGGGRHMVLAHNGREVVNIEAVRVVTTIPTHDVKRVIAIDVGVDGVPGFDAYFKIASLVKGQW